MGKSKKQKNLEARLVELEQRKNSGLFRAIAAFVALAALIAVDLNLRGQGYEWASSTIASGVLFISSIVAAGVAGWGTRTWKKASDEIKEIHSRLK